VSAIEQSEKTGRFAEAGCTFLDFRFHVAQSKFKLSEFSASMESKGFPSFPPRWTVTCLTQFPEKTDYHVHFSWYGADEENLDLSVSYHAGSIPPRQDEKEPYAEQLMHWLGGFFAGNSANANIQARIGYAATLRESRFLLPMRVSIISGVETTIDGISIDFPSRPSGIDTARLTVSAKNIAIILTGVVKLTFDTFDVFEQLSNASRLALSLTEVRRSL